MKIYLVSGKSQSGKNTVSEIIREYYESLGKKVCFLQIMRTLKGYLKDYFNWDGNEISKPRELLQTIGTEIIREKLNKPFFHLDRLIEDLSILENFFDIFVVNDIRLPFEIETLKKRFPQAVSIRVIRENYQSMLTEKEKNHITETALDNYHNFDYVIINTTLEKLKIDVNKIIDSEVLEK